MNYAIRTFVAVSILFPTWHILPSLKAAAQTTPAIQWQNTIGGNADDQLFSAQQTTDGGYILAGTSNSNLSGDKTENSNGGHDYWIVKLDSSGNILWQNTIGGNLGDKLSSVQQTADGGYILGGYSFSDSSGDKTENSTLYDFWLVKTDAAGAVQWDKTLSGIDYEILTALLPAGDGGYVLGGHINELDFLVIKTDSAGNMQWQKIIPKPDYDILHGLAVLGDGRIVCVGRHFNNPPLPQNYQEYGRVAILDSAGGILQNSTASNCWDPPPYSDYYHAVCKTLDNGFIYGGHSCYGFTVEKLNGFTEYYEGTSYDYLKSIAATADSGFVLGTTSKSNVGGDKTQNTFGGYDYWVLRIDSLGNIQWQIDLGGTLEEELTTVLSTQDGGVLCAGYSKSNISGNKTKNSNGGNDYWVVKLAPMSPTGAGPAPASTGGQEAVVMPNPMVENALVTFPNPRKENYRFALYDVTGRLMEETRTTRERLELERGNKQPGIYLFQLVHEIERKQISGKIIIASQ